MIFFSCFVLFPKLTPTGEKVEGWVMRRYLSDEEFRACGRSFEYRGMMEREKAGHGSDK